MLEHEQLSNARLRGGARIYDPERGGQEADRDLERSNNLIILLVSVLILGFVFGLVYLSSLI
jgi:hypothetical protein